MDTFRASEISITGTLIWYYYICHRQVWLMSRQIAPEQDNPNIVLGRYIQEHSYLREKKEVSVGSSKMDIIRVLEEGLVIGEVKKSSRYQKSARMQLAFYLKELKNRGLKATGELRFPQEKKKQQIVLDKQTEEELDRTCQHIKIIIREEKPPPPQKKQLCKNCAYAEFCWA